MTTIFRPWGDWVGKKLDLPRLEDGSAALERLRLRIYLTALIFSTPWLLGGWLLALHNQSADPILTVFFPFLIVLCIGTIAWLLKGRSVQIVDRVGLGLNGLALVVHMGAVVLAPTGEFISNCGTMYWLLVTVALVCTIMLEVRRAGMLMFTGYLVCFALPWLSLWAHDLTSQVKTLELIKIQFSSAIVMLLVFSLAWYRSHSQVEEVRRHQLHQLAYSDALCGVPNRRALYQALDQALERATASNPGSVILIDIDHFKQINDQHGHAAGDEVLKRICDLLRPELSGTDVLGRWGGEEFLVVLPQSARAQAMMQAEHLREVLTQATLLPDRAVTASLGVATVRTGDDLQSLMTRADQALYRAKQQGRNRTANADDPGSYSATAPALLIP